MKIEKYVMGLFGTNTYLISNDEKVILIDPACKAEKMIEILGERKLLGILLTHGHLDHIKAVDGLVKKYNCPVYLSEADKKLSQDRTQGYPFGIDNSPVVNSKTIDYPEGELKIDDFLFEITHTPGHTEGSVVIKIDNDLFSGDTLFSMSVGRTDLEGGSNSKLKSSLRLLMEMDDNLTVHPGHESETTLGFEKQNNPFLR